MKPPRRSRWVIAAMAIAPLAVPAALPESALSVYILFELTAIVTVGVSLLMGYAGQVSLGQAAFYASGAYAAALAALHGVPTLAGLFVAPAVAAVFALIVGMPLLRLRGHHLAFATLATQLICLSMVGRMHVTGGDIGLQGIPRLALGRFELQADRDYAYLGWLALALVVVIARNVMRSRPGRGLRALATSEVAAESSGVPVGRYKLAVFALAAAFAGLAGGVYAFYVGYVAPGSFPVLLSLQYVVMAVVGGLGTVEGALVGAAVVTAVVQVLNYVATLAGMPGYAPSVLSYAAFSMLLISCVLFLPEGLTASRPFRALAARWRAKATSPR